MGTRSLTHVKDNGNTILTLYRQFDGYPDGHGQDIKGILAGKALVNGYNDKETQINGMSSAAAMLVAGLVDRDEDGKPVTGGFYLRVTDAEDCGEEYTYTLTGVDNIIHVKCQGWGGKAIYDGPLDDFPCTEPDEDD